MNDDMMSRFERLYDQMSASGEVKNMRLFGSVMKEMFAWFAAYKAEAAENWLEKLESMKWKNYLTRHEAEEVVSKMTPKCPWRYDVWQNAMTSYGMVTEEMPYYNSYALWAVMCMIYSDSASSIKSIMKMGGVESMQDKELLVAIHMLAVDKLKDADGVFDVRKYFFN